MKKNIYIIGAGGFANELTQYIIDTGKYQIKGYFDINDIEYNHYQYSSPFLGSEDNFNFNKNDNVVIANANFKIRYNIYKKLKDKNLYFPKIIHRSAFISNVSSIEEGAIICPFVTITSNITIGKNFQANIYSYIAHDCIIGDNVTFGPAVKCNGNVIIEDNVYIGTGAIIHQGKKNKPLIIGNGVVIAAGSVVTKSLLPKKTFFGNPAIELTKKNLKKRC